MRDMDQEPVSTGRHCAWPRDDEVVVFFSLVSTTYLIEQKSSSTAI